MAFTYMSVYITAGGYKALCGGQQACTVLPQHRLKSHNHAQNAPAAPGQLPLDAVSCIACRPCKGVCREKRNLTVFIQHRAWI